MLKIPGYFTGYSSRSDNGMGLRFITQEVDPATSAELQAHLNLFGTIVFRENEMQDEDIPKEDAEEGKTPSKRLRSVLYVLWSQGGKQGTFEAFYRDKMDKLIEWAKAKLDPL